MKFLFLPLQPQVKDYSHLQASFRKKDQSKHLKHRNSVHKSEHKGI